MKKTTLKKVVVAGEKLDDSDDIRNLEDLPRHMFNDEECGNLKPKMLDFLKVAFSGWWGGGSIWLSFHISQRTNPILI